MTSDHVEKALDAQKVYEGDREIFFPNNGGNTHALFVGDTGFIGGYYTKSLSGNTSSWKGAIWTPDFAAWSSVTAGGSCSGRPAPSRWCA